MSELTYYQRNKDMILNRAKDYHENNKDRLRRQTRDKYRNLPKEDKNKNREMEEIDTIIYLKKKNIKKIS